MRAPLFGVVVASCILCAFGCDRGEPEVQVGERPEEPPRPEAASTAGAEEPGSILRFSGRWREITADEDGTILSSGGPELFYRIEPLDGGFVRGTPTPEELRQDIFVRPLSRFRVTITGEGCQTSIALRSRTAGDVLDLSSLACVGGELISAVNDLETPFLDFDISEDRRLLAIHDGHRLFLTDGETSRQVPVEASVRARPRFAGELVLYRSSMGVRAYDTARDVALDGSIPGATMEHLLVASDAPVAVIFGSEPAFGDNLAVAITWENGSIEEIWRGATQFPAAATLSPSGNRIAYSLGDRHVVESLREDEPYRVEYRQGGGEVVFTRNGEHEMYIGAAVAYDRQSTVAMNVKTIAPSGEDKLLIITWNNQHFLYDFATEERAEVSFGGSLAGNETFARAMAFPPAGSQGASALVVRDAARTYVIDADTLAVAHELDGMWRPFEVGQGRLLLISNWEMPQSGVVQEYPLCNPPDSPCEAKLLEPDLSESWSSEDVSAGLPLGADSSATFTLQSKRLNDGCTPATFKNAGGETLAIPGMFCHVQSRPARYFQAPCLPFSVTEGLGQGVYCAR